MCFKGIVMWYQKSVFNALLRCMGNRVACTPQKSQRTRFRVSRGFTAIEFMLAIAALSVVFISVVAGASQRNERLMINEVARTLQFSLSYARHQAINRRSAVQLCPTVDLVNCSDQGNWNQPWMVVDTDTGEIMRLVEPAAEGVRLTADAGVRHHVQFNELGDAFGTAGTFVVCHPDQADFAMVLQLSAVGEMEHLDAASGGCPADL